MNPEVHRKQFSAQDKLLLREIFEKYFKPSQRKRWSEKQLDRPFEEFMWELEEIVGAELDLTQKYWQNAELRRPLLSKELKSVDQSIANILETLQNSETNIKMSLAYRLEMTNSTNNFRSERIDSLLRELTSLQRCVKDARDSLKTGPVALHYENVVYRIASIMRVHQLLIVKTTSLTEITDLVFLAFGAPLTGLAGARHSAWSEIKDMIDDKWSSANPDEIPWD